MNPSTPNPQLVDIIVKVLHLIVTAAGGSAILTDSYITQLAGVIALALSLAWGLYDQWRQAKLAHQGSVVSAQQGKALMPTNFIPGVK